jgi:hypothetical protein
MQLKVIFLRIRIKTTLLHGEALLLDDFRKPYLWKRIDDIHYPKSKKQPSSIFLMI